ncbi:hypothetical protein DPMN_125235 [Dreissena polymorpha]|uniref:Uncharacterized protein n=1 Tax=Dreissena polymorpha TaxID=45954 RepID=A0A9D4GXT7_DREPO|nr:hypothetical protein DPMN_125235 [Dreissena polymorpha]
MFLLILVNTSYTSITTTTSTTTSTDNSSSSKEEKQEEDNDDDDDDEEEEEKLHKHNKILIITRLHWATLTTPTEYIHLNLLIVHSPLPTFLKIVSSFKSSLS